MPPHDSSNRDRDSWSRLRHFVDDTKRIDNARERPGPVSCKRPTSAPVAPAYDDDDDDDAPITIRWAVG